MIDKELEDVRKFHKKFGLLEFKKPGRLTYRKLYERCECISEELYELYVAHKTRDLAAQADALVDLVYFAKGTALMLGLPWVELWNDVQRANMEKVRGVGHRGHAVDCVKPPGWRGPQTEKILRKHGYNKNKVEVLRDDENFL